MKEFRCLECKIRFQAKASSNRKYCSLACYHAKPERNPFYGRKHTDRAKKTIGESTRRRFGSGPKNPFYGKRHTAESRRKMSESRSRKIASGEINPINTGRKGNHNGVDYHSAYEKKRIMMLEQDSRVKSFTRSQHSIPYWDGTRWRRYVPDFVVRYDDSLVVEEVKGYETDKDRCKYQHARGYFAGFGVRFVVLYKDDLFADNAEYRRFLCQQ